MPSHKKGLPVTSKSVASPSINVDIATKPYPDDINKSVEAEPSVPEQKLEILKDK